jgi:hypothetical protein
MRKIIAVLGLLLLALLVTACTFPIKVEESVLPTPAIDPIPASVAVVYGKEFRTYVHIGPSVRDGGRNDISYGVNNRYKLGASNVSLFDQLAENMFERSNSYNSWEALKAADEEFDAILEPTIEHFDSWRGEAGAYLLGVFLDLTYGIRMYGPQGNEMMSWSLESHIVFCDKGTTLGCRHTPVVEAGMRDIAAQFYMKFVNLPQVANWMETLQTDP